MPLAGCSDPLEKTYVSPGAAKSEFVPATVPSGWRCRTPSRLSSAETCATCGGDLATAASAWQALRFPPQFCRQGQRNHRSHAQARCGHRFPSHRLNRVWLGSCTNGFHDPLPPPGWICPLPRRGCCAASWQAGAARSGPGGGGCPAAAKF